MTHFIEVQGDILDSSSEAIVIPVNCVGAMGKGLALDAARKWPNAERFYKLLCKAGAVTTNGPMMAVKLTNGPYIVFFPTKQHWRDKSEYIYIQNGLVALRTWIEETGITSISIPKLGCGLGGLQWPRVQRMIWQELTGNDALQVDIYI